MKRYWRDNMVLNKIIKSVSVKKVENKVSHELELTRYLLDYPKTPIFFKNVNNQKVLGNLWSKRERIEKYFQCNRQNLIKKILSAIDKPVECEVVEKAPFMENIIKDVDLYKLPIPKFYPKDGGRYLTAAICVAEWNGKRNLSYHRLMVLDKNHFVGRIVPRHLYRMMTESIEKFGEFPVTFIVGTPLEIMLSAALSVSYEEDELKIASALQKSRIGKPLQLIYYEKDFIAPVESEYVFQCKILNKRAKEGPFVDICNLYDSVRDEPVIKVERIYHCTDPILQIILPGGYEHFYMMGMPREPLLYRSLTQSGINVKDVRLTEGGCSWLHGIVSIKKSREGDGKNAILAAFAGHSSMKHVIVVDDDIDIYNEHEVEWAIATRFQADKGIVIVPGATMSSLDPSSQDGFGTKMGIDATKPLKGKEKFERARL